MKSLTSKQGRSQWERGGGQGDIPPIHFNFRAKKGPTVSVSIIRDIAFKEFPEIVWTKYFTIFCLHARIFGQYTAPSHSS